MKATKTQLTQALRLTLLAMLDNLGETLNNWLFSRLRDEYDYLTSREAIEETIKANEYTFTESGKLENA